MDAKAKGEELKLSVILGTRPEIIKMSPIVRECERLGIDFFILHTGQHYSYELDGVFFEQLKLPRPKYNLRVGSGTYAEELSRMLTGIEWILVEEKPSIVLIVGDTNTCASAALTATKSNIKVGHIEAGIRSYFSGMAEEINRVVADHAATYLFAPTNVAKINLVSEGISADRVYVTGNTIVDMVMQSGIRRNAGSVGKYALVTLHRYENVRSRERYESILRGLEMVGEECGLEVVYPTHPGAKKMMESFNLKVGSHIKMVDAMGYLSFLKAEAEASVVLTDSGGVQEETCILGVPCVTLRDNTERPETLEIGANVLAGASSEKILECTKMMLNKECNWKQPFGDGHAAERIIEIIRRVDG